MQENLVDTSRLSESDKIQMQEELEALVISEVNEIESFTQGNRDELMKFISNGLRSALDEKMGDSHTIPRQTILAWSRQAIGRLSSELLMRKQDDASDEVAIELDRDLKQGMTSGNQFGTGGGRRVIRSTRHFGG